MSTPTSTPPTDPQAFAAIPPLRAGDRLSREEFERRYEAMPPETRAELLEGKVFMPSPVRFRCHGQPHRWLSTWLGVYEAATPGVSGADEATIRLDVSNEPQPDLVLFLLPEHGSQVRISDDDYIEFAPELVVEVSASSADRDLSAKFNAYCRNEVREYLVFRTEDRKVDWFAWKDGKYEPLTTNDQGWICSQVFPGLWLDEAALLRGDLPALLAGLQQGLASPEHAAFVARLKSSSAPAAGTP